MAGSSVTLRLERPAPPCAGPRYPIRLNTRTASGGTATVYFPCASVTVLGLLPRTRTVSPETGLPPTAEGTVPGTSTGCWGNAGAHTQSARARATPTARRSRVPGDGWLRGAILIRRVMRWTEGGKTHHPTLRMCAAARRRLNAMRLPSYSVTEYRHGRTYGSTSAGLKYASEGDPA